MRNRRTGSATVARMLCALAGGSAALIAANEAAAQATAATTDPRALMDRALADFRAGNFRPALQSFQRVFDLTGNPAILFNIAVTWQRLGEPGEAARALRRFLVAQPQAPNRAEVEQQIHSLEEEDAHLHPAVPTVSSAPGNTASSPPPPTVTPPPPQRSIIGPVVVAAAGGAALVTGIVFFALREGALGELRSACDTTMEAWNCPNDDHLRARYADAGTFTAVSIVTGVVGLVAIAGGVTWLLLPSRGSRRDTARFGVDVNASGGSITLGGTF